MIRRASNRASIIRECAIKRRGFNRTGANRRTNKPAANLI